MSTSPQASEAQTKSEWLPSSLEAAWLLIAIVIPLWVNLWAQQPFELSKSVLFRTLVWLLAALWLADCVSRKQSVWRELARNPLLWPVVGLSVTLILATLGSVDPRLSLWGSYERAQGLLTMLSYVLLFLVVSSRLRTQEQAERLLAALVGASVLLILVGWVQAGGWQPLGLSTDARSQVAAMLGRSNFLGAYLAMLLPLTLALAVGASSHRRRVALAALLAAQVSIVMLSLARGAWLATVAGLGVFGLLWIWPQLSRRGRVLTLAGVALVLLSGSLLGAYLLSQAAEGSIAARATVWRATLDLITERPVLGYGPETLKLVFPSVYPPQLVYYQGRDVFIDRAHNFLLDWLVSSGVLGALAWLILLGAFAWLGWRTWQSADNTAARTLLAGCLAAVVANLAGNLVSFDVTATASATWLLMALVVGVSMRTAELPTVAGEATSRADAVVRWSLVGIIMLGALAAVVQANLRPLLADVAIKRAEDRLARGDQADAQAAAQWAQSLWPAEPTYHLWLGHFYLRRAMDEGSAAEWLARAESELLAAAELRPREYTIWASLGELYGVWGNHFAPERLVDSQAAFAQALQLAPNHAGLYVLRGLVDMEGGRFAEAEEWFRQAVNLDATHAHGFRLLGDALLAQRSLNEAVLAYQEALHWDPELGRAYLGLAHAYWWRGEVDMAELALERAVRLLPGHPVAQALQAEMEGRER